MNTITNLINPGSRMSQISLPPAVLSQCVGEPKFVLQKMLQKTDLKREQARLLLTRKEVQRSRLFEQLTSVELDEVFEGGLEVRVFDQHGREHSMLLRFLESTNTYRLIKQWSQFLRYNDGEIREGDYIAIWVFRILKHDGSRELGMGLRYGKVRKQEQQEYTEDEWTAAEALLLLKETMERDDPKGYIDSSCGPCGT